MRKLNSLLHYLALIIWVSPLAFFAGCGNKMDVAPVIVVTADAGQDIVVDFGETVNITGTGGSSDGATVGYGWEITTAPPGSSLLGFTASTAMLTFVPDMAGEYTAKLTVTNSAANLTATDDTRVTINQTNGPVEIYGTISVDSVLRNIYTDAALPDYYASALLLLDAGLTVEPGVKIIFAADAGIQVNTGGFIKAVGTATDSVVFTGEQEVTGYWRGISIESNNLENQLVYSAVNYAGSQGFDGANLKANIMVEVAGRLKMTNSVSRYGAGYGLYLRDPDTKLDGFAGNVLTGNDAPVMALINHYQYFDVASDYTGNTKNYIDSDWSNNATAQDVTWNALNVPYRLAGNIEQIGSAITISPGTVFLGQPGSGIEVNASGSLMALGTANEMITFKGEQDIAGYWRGLVFQSNTTANELTYAVVANGGEQGFDGANIKANILVEDAGRLKMTNATVKTSAGYGLYTRHLASTLDGFANNIITGNDVPVMTLFNHYQYFDINTDFTGNTKDYIDSDWSNNATAQDVTWQALTVPYRLANNMEKISSAITIAPGAEFIGQPGSGLEVQTTGALTIIGTSTMGIIFRGEQDITGYWLGLRYLSNSAQNTIDYLTISNGGVDGFDGGNRKANLEVGGSGTLEMTNSAINKSGGYGVRVQAGGLFTESNNTYSGNISGPVLMD